MKKMKISIVVPVYNIKRRLLEACLESVVKQTLRVNEYEVVIVDDCSSEVDTIKVIDDYLLQRNNVRVVKHAINKGLNEARRTGVKESKGKYVVFVDGDDILYRDAIEKLRMEAFKTNADVVCGSSLRWNDLNKTYSNLSITEKAFPSDYLERIKSVLETMHSFTMCGRLYRCNILNDEVFDLPNDLLHEDMTTFVRVIFKAKKVTNIKSPIYYCTLNTDSITNSFSAKHVEGVFFALRDWVINAKRIGKLQLLTESITCGVAKSVKACVVRCLNSRLSLDDKFQMLKLIYDSCADFPLTRKGENIEEISTMKNNGFWEEPKKAIDSINKLYANKKESVDKLEDRLRFGMEPSEIACRLKDKIVFVAQVDYQVRSAALFARKMRLRGHPCIVLDNSLFASGGARQLSPDEKNIFYTTEHIKIEKPPYCVDWLSTAKMLIVFNDFNEHFRDALEFRNRLGLPTVCMVEGINDFLRVDFDHIRYLPYRRCDNVFMAGENDKIYFEDRKTYVVGLPIIEELSKKVPIFPGKSLAILNVNFSYGCLESARDGYISAAKSAFALSGMDWVITRHPMDKGIMDQLPVSEKTQYQLIDEGTVFVSRFATGILEALASGKPAIYFNPHGEKVEKFKDPLGAFEIAVDIEGLHRALCKVLKDVEKGVDFRKRALPFLYHHTGYSPEGPSVLDAFAKAVDDVLVQENDQKEYASNHFFSRLEMNKPFARYEAGQIYGTFNRLHKIQLNEEELIGRYFNCRGNIMIDVGANFGNSLDIFLGQGWTVHAFEPDPSNRKQLQKNWPDCSNLILNEEAVSNKAGQKLPFFASKESTGISSLSAFTDGHQKVCEVTTTTLMDYYNKLNISHVNFLKIDVEGYDKFVLDGFPWDRDRPEVILVEFEDSKTLSLGYSAHDLAHTIIHHGYTVYVSEWMPIVRYGITHDWKRFVRYSSKLDLTNTWGNMIGFHEKPDERKLKSLIKQTLKMAKYTVIKPKPEELNIRTVNRYEYEKDYVRGLVICEHLIQQYPLEMYKNTAERLRKKLNGWR